MDDSVYQKGAGVATHRLEPYLDRLLGYAVSLTSQMEQARDLVQSCALKALTASVTPKDEPAYRAWLFRILRNLHIDQLRREARSPVVESLADEEIDGMGNSGPTPDVFSFQHRQLNQLAVRDGLSRLRLDHREILVLVDMAGFSYQEAADLIQVPVGTVMSRLSRAREALLTELGGARRTLPIRLRMKMRDR